MKVIKNILLMLTTITVTGCGVEQRSSGDVRYFLLDVQRQATEAAVKNAACLHIRPCRMAAPFAGRSLVYRTSTVLYEQDYYNLFLTNPDDQITDALRSLFRQAGFGECVSTEDSTGEKYTLEPHVDILYTDFSDEENPVATVQIHVLLTKFDESCSCPKVMLEKTYSSRTPLSATPAAAQVVEGLSSSLSQILQQLESDLVSAM